MLRGPAAALLVAVAVAGCGGGGGQKKAESPLDDALGYLPKSAPFVLAVQTNPAAGQVDSALGLFDKVPFGGQVLDQLKQELSSRGIDFDKDLRPLLGNPVAIGAPSLEATRSGRGAFVGAWKAKSEDALARTLKGLDRVGETDGASIYGGTGAFFARKGDVLVFAPTRPAVESAIETRGKDEHFTEEEFDAGVGSVPKGALVRAYFATRALIASSGAPGAAQARKVPWIGALKTTGAAVSATDGQVAFDLDFLTDRVAPPDLPLALASGSPPVLQRSGEQGALAFALHDPAHVIDFFQRAAQKVNPARFDQFGIALKAIRDRFGVDFDNDVVKQLKGDSEATVTLAGKFALRSDLADPAAFKKTLGRAAKVLPGVLKGAGLGGAAVTSPRAAGGLYAVALGNGRSFAYGVVGDRLVVTNSPDRAAALASAATQPVPGASGALAGAADAEGLANDAISRVQPGPLGDIGGSLFTGPLGEVTLSAGDDPDNLHARIAVKID